MRKVFFFLLVLFLVSCADSQRSKTVTLRKGNWILKGDITNDTIFNDTILSYNLENLLIRSEVYSNNKLNGLVTEYHPNGKAQQQTLYTNGLKNGTNTYYDSLGKRIYQDYNYYGLMVGPIIYFDSLERPMRYFFSNLHNEDLLDIDYRKWNGIKDVFSNCINFIKSDVWSDSTPQTNLFLYFMEPPKFDFTYSLHKKNINSEKEYVEVMKLNNVGHLPFLQQNLPKLSDDVVYWIRLNVYDSIQQKESVIYKEF